MQRGDPKETGGDLKRQLNVAIALVDAVSFPTEVWTNRFGTWGPRYLGMQAVLGLIWPVVFGTFCGPHPRIGDLFQFWVLTMVLLLVHRVAGMVRRRRGYTCHSRYWGTSWFERGPGIKAQRRARTADAVAVSGVGLLFFSAGSVPLGAFLLIGGVAKLVSDGMHYHATAMRVQQMEDARIENEYYADLYRERNR